MKGKQSNKRLIISELSEKRMIFFKQSEWNMLLKQLKVQALSWTMDTTQDKGQRLARIAYFPQALIQKQPNDQLKTVKIQNIASTDEYSMSLTGIILFSEVAPICCGKRKQAAENQKQPSHKQSRNRLQTTYQTLRQQPEKCWVVEKKKDISVHAVLLLEKWKETNMQYSGGYRGSARAIATTWDQSIQQDW